MANLDELLSAIYRRDLSALAGFTAADVRASDQNGRTALMHAVLAENPDPSVVKALIDLGADINAVDADQKWTPLHFATRDQKESIVRVLLDAGATVDAVDAFGNTPLWRSVMNGSANTNVLKMLVEHGADPNRKNLSGVAPIDIARRMGRDDIVALFDRRSPYPGVLTTRRSPAS